MTTSAIRICWSNGSLRSMSCASCASTRPELLRLSAPQPDFAADLWLLTHSDLRQSARVRVFLDFVAAEIGRWRKLIEGGASATKTDAASARAPA
jgi:hypothetical protein